MPIGALTLAPSGFNDFCRREMNACRPRDGEGTVVLTKARWRELNDTNVAINRAVRPVTDQALYQRAEYWTYATTAGDCEDYALNKRRALIALGWPESALLLATARNSLGELHAVLVATTDRGDFVLDNVTNFVDPWEAVPYRWVSRQDRAAPLAWHRAGTAAQGTGTAALR